MSWQTHREHWGSHRVTSPHSQSTRHSQFHWRWPLHKVGGIRDVYGISNIYMMRVCIYRCYCVFQRSVARLKTVPSNQIALKFVLWWLAQALLQPEVVRTWKITVYMIELEGHAHFLKSSHPLNIQMKYWPTKFVCSYYVWAVGRIVVNRLAYRCVLSQLNNPSPLCNSITVNSCNLWGNRRWESKTELRCPGNKTPCSPRNETLWPNMPWLRTW